MDQSWVKFGPTLGQIGPNQPILKVNSMPLKIITTVSAYIKLLELTPVPNWVKWTKVGSNLGQIRPNFAKKNANWIGVPILIVETVPFGSRCRFNCYDHPRSNFCDLE